jgi:adenylate cyclase
MTARSVWTHVAVVAIALICGTLVALPPLDGLRGLSLDLLTALRWRAFGAAHDPAASPTVVIALDPDSYQTPPFKGTPTVTWTREIGRVVGAAIDGGAEVVGFDVVFPTSIEDSAIAIGEETIGTRMRGFDRDFLRALANGARDGKIVLGEVQNGDELILPAAGQRAAVGQQRNIRSLNVYSERDGVVRRAPLMLKVGDRAVPSMSLELASRAVGVAPQVNRDASVNLGDYRIPGSDRNTTTLNFEGGSDDIPTYSFADLDACLQKGDVDFFRRNFEHKVVLFGSKLDFEDDKITSKRFAIAPAAQPPRRCASSAGAPSRGPRSSIDGVYVHATAINNLIRREAITEVSGPTSWLVATLGALLGAFAALLLTPSAAALGFLLVGLVWCAGATAAFAQAFALPLLDPLAAGLIALIATTSFRLFTSDKDKRFLRKAFELYLPPAIIERMVNSSKPPVLGGETREVTLFFSDVAGFSSFAERMNPAELVSLMNRYLSAMTDIIEKNGGFVDKYIGDAIVAVFGAPVADADHAANAVRAALACSAELEVLNAATAAADSPKISHRVGLNSGPALVGNIGSRRRFNYTAMGDCVNLASRLEGANKYFGTSILASESAKTLAGASFAWREIENIRVKGRAEPVRIFEPIAEAGRQTAEQLARTSSYAEGLRRWRRRDFAGAEKSFAAYADIDPPSALFATKAREWSLRSDEMWEPVHTLEEK